MSRISDVAENSDFVQSVIRKYSDYKDYRPITNVSLTLDNQGRTYKIIRLTDDQFRLFHKNALGINDDYHLSTYLARDNKLIYSNFPKIYATLKQLFGESGRFHDDWKGSFSFPFLIHFEETGQEYIYLLKIYNFRSFTEFKFAKVVSKQEAAQRHHDPFPEMTQAQITYFINHFVGFLTGYSESLDTKELSFFYHVVRSNGIVYGFKEGQFFNHSYEDEEKLNRAIDKLEAYKAKLSVNRSEGKS